jgi:hypothetical protein
MHYLLLFLAVISAACGNADTLVANRAPQAFAGFDQAVVEGSLVTLDGSRSFDPDGNGLTYDWRMIEPSDQVELSDSTHAQVTLQGEPGFSGNVIVELIVHDGATSSRPDWVSVNFVGAANLARPVAVAGVNQHLRRGQPLVLDAGASEGVIDAYRWSHLLGPSTERQLIGDDVTALLNDLELGMHVFGLSVGAENRWSMLDCLSVYVDEADRNDPFPEISVESNSSGTLFLQAQSPSAPTWALISSPSGASTLLAAQGDNPTRLEYRSESAGLHLFAATLANGLTDWIAVELETPL